MSECRWTLIENAKSSGFGTVCGYSNEKADRWPLSFGGSRRPWPGENVMQLDDVRREIEHMRVQVGRQRREILQLQRAGISTASAETLLQRMLNKIDGLSAERDRLKKDQPGPTTGKVLGGRQW